MNTRKLLSNGYKYAIITSLFICISGFPYIITRGESKREELYSRTLKTADTNKDGRTSMDEWAGVYKDLGHQFDELNPNRPLSREDLEKYLFSQEETSLNQKLEK